MNLKEELMTQLKSMGKHQIIYGLSHNGSTQKNLIQGVIESLESYMSQEEIQNETDDGAKKYRISLEILKS